MLLTILKNKSLDYLRLEQNKLNAMSELSELYVRELDIRVSSLEACDPSEISKPPYAHSRNKPEESLK